MSMAKITWENDRYEMEIDGKLKAYTEGDHEKGLGEMEKMAEQKGYTVHIEKK